VPAELNWETAMEMCIKILGKCDILIIASNNWLRSSGCKDEVKWAIENGKPIYIFNPVWNEIFKVEDSDIAKFKIWISEKSEEPYIELSSI